MHVFVAEMRPGGILLLAAAALGAVLAHGSSVIDLGESSWVVVNGNGSVTATTTVPAYPLEVLRSQGVISDPLYRYGELENRWVALDNWTFSLNFSGSTPAMQQLLAEKQILLKFDGIDTFATVTLNGQDILEANNFHRRWAVPVKGILVPGDNLLTVSIRPAMQESLKLKEQHPYSIPAIHQMGSVGAYNFIRKPASDGGWDWGPAYMASGIHGKVELVGFSNAIIDDAYVQQNKVGDQFEVLVSSELLVPPGGDEGVLTVAIPELKLEDTRPVRLHDTNRDSTSLIKTTFTTKLTIDANQVELWWPVGYGAPRLYNVTVTYAPAEPAGCSAQEAAVAQPMQDRTPATAGTAAAVPVGVASFNAPLPAAVGKPIPESGTTGAYGAADTPGGYSSSIAPSPGAYTMQNSGDASWPVTVAAEPYRPGVYGTGAYVDTSSELPPDGNRYLPGGRSSGGTGEDELPAGSGAVAEQPSRGGYDMGDIGSRGFVTPGTYAFGLEDQGTTTEAPLLQDDQSTTAAHPNPSNPPTGPAVQTDSDHQTQSEAPTDAAGDAGSTVDDCTAAAASSKTYRIGFRTVELVRLPIPQAVNDLFPAGESGWDVNSTFGVSRGEKDGSWALVDTGKWQWVPPFGNQSYIEGESFYFKVNGIPVYMKGANIIPMNVLPTNVTKEMIHDVLDYALESNMNMVRVWGGGMYPVPEVFDYCDEKGLLVWMEAMFACSPYPRDVAFLENVAEEVTQQVHRLSWHPSIAAWSGNNEVEGSLNWYSESRTNMQLFAGDYIALYIDTIRAILKKAQPSMPFVDSSPSNGAIVDTPEQYVKRWGGDWDPRYGDVHHYAYEADCEDWSTYPKAKFISEFGSQSYPTFQTYASVTTPQDWQVDNKMTGFRNRRFGNGLEVFEAQFRRHFRLPANWTIPNDPQESYKLFRSFIYITHMQQARCYETAINYWRRLRSQPAGLNMGVLYWQLNDIAEFASWSSYDYGGRWKPLAYAVKRMYAPIQVQAFQDGNYTKIFVVNDHTAPVNVEINMQLLSLADNSTTCEQKSNVSEVPTATIAVPDAETTFQATVPPGFASQVLAVPTAQILATVPGCTKTTCYLDVTATSKSNSTNSGLMETSETQMFFTPLKDIDLPNPSLNITGFRTVAPEVHNGAGVDSSVNSGVNSAGNPVSFVLTSSRPAVLTYLNTKYRGRFSDDAFMALHPCKPKEITFYPHSSVQGLVADDLAADLTVESLFDHQFGTAAKPARPVG